MKNKFFVAMFISLFLASAIFVSKFYMIDIFSNSLRGKSITVTAHMVDIPTYSNNICKYNVKIDEIENVYNFPKFKMQLISTMDINCDVYQKFKVKIRVLENTNLRENLKLRAHGMKLSGMISSYEPIERFEVINNVKYFVLKIKEKLLRYTTKIFDIRSESFIRAFLFRDRSMLDNEEILSFSEAGISHFLAISGFHLSIMIKILENLFIMLHAKRRISYFLCCAFILFFMIITGFVPSIVRSGTMFLIFMMSKIFFKNYDSLNSLGISLFVVLLINSDSCLDIGLWLSFLSSASIICLSGKLKNFIFLRLKNLRIKLLRYVISNFSDSLVATICVFPISCLYFKTFSLVFFLSNLLIAFQVYILILIAILALIFNKLPIFSFLPEVSNVISKSILETTKFLSQFSVSLDYPFIPICVACILILTSYFVLFLDIKKDFLKIFTMSLIFFVLGIISYQLNRIGSFNVNVLCQNYSKDIVISNQKSNIIILKSKKLNNLNKFLQKNCVILSDNNLETEIKNYLNIKENISYKFEAWDKKINITAEKIKGKTWIKINCLGTIIIVSTEGGDIKKLPKNWLNCDVFIAFKLPNNFKLLNFENIIFADNSWTYGHNCNKILSYRNYVSDGYDILLNLKNSGYVISRKV